MRIPEISLPSSQKIPLVGLGTWEMQGEICEKTLRKALTLGYRHIDTALLYENHVTIRKATAGIPREELFFTSKFLIHHLQKGTVTETCERSLRELGCDYLDLFLLHNPDRSYPMETIYEELESLKESGKIKGYGASNCTVRHLADIFDWGFAPIVNQVEFHPYLYQKELLEFCEQNQVQIISFRSLGKGALAQNALLENIGKKYGKTAAQISLKWLVEKKIPVIPKTTSPKHLKENLELFDFSLDADDWQTLENMPNQYRYCNHSWSDFDYL
ncbi:MAG: putative oxidoreductase [Chlamydiae bacterium]|nr:putative oxidoreductase [Chlamydiota bacterium]